MMVSNYPEYVSAIERNYSSFVTLDDDDVSPDYFSRLGSDSEFYRFSFYHRQKLEFEYQLLEMLATDATLDATVKAQVIYQLLACAHTLLRDATIADNSAEAQKYRDKLSQYVFPLNQKDETQTWEKLKEDMSAATAVPFHVSKMITVLSYVNIYRLLSLFSRLSVGACWSLAHQLQWLDAQDIIFGHHINRAILAMPVDIYNFLSVFLFVSRLSLHVSMMIKHAISQREGEKDIDWVHRLLREFYTRMAHIMNDLVWMVINLLTNFAAVWGIANPLANILLAGALVFDSTWLGIQWYCQERDLSEMKAGIVESSWGSTSVNAQIKAKKLVILEDQVLETRIKFLFSILAGLSIMTSYLLVLAMASAVVSAIGLTICVVGFGMYASADEFAAWGRAHYAKAPQNANAEQEARTAFFKAWAKATLTPLLIVAAFSISWQIAVLALIFIAARPYLPAMPSCTSLMARVGFYSADEGTAAGRSASLEYLTPVQAV